MSIKVQLWLGVWSLIAIVWGIFVPLIVEKLTPLATGVKKMCLVAFYCLISAVIVIGGKTAFQINNGLPINWQSMADVATVWLMLVTETKITWEAFWRKGFTNNP